MGKFFPARESLVSDIPAWDGNTPNIFYSVSERLLVGVGGRGAGARVGYAGRCLFIPSQELPSQSDKNDVQYPIKMREKT